MHWLIHHYQPKLLPAGESSLPKLTRRAVLHSLGGVGVGLMLGVAATEGQAQSGAAAVMRGRPGGAAPAFNGFVRVTPDNIVIVTVKHLEMGQGPYTGLATLVAEEMDADWAQVRAESAPADAQRYKNNAFGMQGTGGSTAIANSYEQMRQAGAAARAMLVGAASQAWNVPAGQITVEAGRVRHAASGRQATFGELAERAAALPAPTAVTLKDPSQFKLIGKPRAVGKLDSGAKSTGTALYTIDMDRPGLLTVLVEHPPRFGSTVASVDATATRAIAGVVDVRTLAGGVGVAVFATGFWAAKKGREALRVSWNEARAEKRGSGQMLADFRAAAAQPGQQAVLKGDPARALAAGGRTIEAEYIFPYLAHAPMEPMDCMLELKGGACEAWYGAQMQTFDHGAIAKVLGLPQDKVQIHTLMAGGSFGRRAQPASDIATEAALALKALGRDAAIKLVWTREDDMRGGRYRPFVVHKVRTALDTSGGIAAWDHTIAAQSFIKGTPMEQMMKGGIDPTMVEGAFDMPYGVPNLRVGQQIMEGGVTTLWWRSVGHTHTAFVVETMLDELLAAAGKDPVQGRLDLLKDHPREAGVLRQAARMAAWNGARVGGGKARGVAVHKSFDTYVAQVAEVSRGQDGLPRVERVWCAVDCGVAVNPDVIRSQMEGGIGFGLNAILYSRITLEEGRVVESNFHDYPMLRIHEMPRVEVSILDSKEKPTGVGEPGVPPIGPAVANAWRVLTGTPVRELPFAAAAGRTA